ncbi:hypothetical protein GCM10009022_22630 [Vreelandella titanicae]
MPVGFETACSLKNGAIERAPDLCAENSPTTGAATPFRKRGSGLKERDYLGKRIEQHRTPAN